MSAEELQENAIAILENLEDFQHLMMCYNAAMLTVKTKLDILNIELTQEERRLNPIEAIHCRLKEPFSIIKKLERRHLPLTIQSIGELTDIAGLLRDKDDETTLIPEVEVSEIEGYKSAGIIAGGMIPKIGGMADAIYQGVHEAVIIDGRVPHSILLELFSNRGSGTRFYRRSHRE